VKLLVFSHPAITPANQEFFARVHDHLDGDVTLVLPARWRNEYGVQSAARWPGFRGKLVPIPVLLQGNIILHAYRARLRRLIRGEAPDVIYVHHEPYAVATTQVALAARGLEIPLGFYSAQNLVKRYPPPIRVAERFVHRHAAFAAAVAPAVAETLSERGYRGHIADMPLGVDTSAPPIARRGETGPLVAGYVGRLAEEKGVEVLLDAIARLPAEDARAVIAGDGPDAQALHRRADELMLGKRVAWLGYVPHSEVERFYAQIDVLVVPSRTRPNWKEQFGRVVIEALTFGIPVVTSDSGELPRLVELTKGGWTFPEDDVPALAEVLARVAEAPAERLERAEVGRGRVRELFDVDALAARFAALVRDSASRGR
jgi:glycosyltransferase involved in cell wall biosynthesis